MGQEEDLHRAIEATQERVEQLKAELRRTHPVLVGNLAYDGILLGRGVAALVAIGWTNDQIADHVRRIADDVRAHAARATRDLTASRPPDRP